MVVPSCGQIRDRRLLVILLTALVVTVKIALFTETNKRATQGVGTTTSRENLPPPYNFSLIWEQAQSQAQRALTTVSGKFDTIVTNRNTVLSKGYPINWDSCTIQKILSRKLRRQYYLQPQQSDPSSSTSNDRLTPPTLQIVVLGGSASSRPGEHCKPVTKRKCNDTMATAKQTNVTTQDLYQGRYSNILEHGLNEQMGQTNLDCPKTNHTTTNATTPPANIHFEIVNMAQGSVESTTNALLLDELVDPHEADILIHEFLLNDLDQGTQREHVKKFRFWLTRVKALFAHAHKPPPPILLLFLWRPAMGSMPPQMIRQKGFDNHPLELLGPVLEEFQNNNQHPKWQFQAVNVGAVINTEQAIIRLRDLIDDVHHPSCMGATLIADMAQFAIYDDIAKCDAEDLEESDADVNDNPALLRLSLSSTEPELQNATVSNSSRSSSTTTTTSQSTQSGTGSATLVDVSGTPVPDILGDADEQYTLLWTDLFREDAITASFIPWEPRNKESATNLHIANLQEILQTPPTLTTKSEPDRQDRKYGYLLPNCTSGEAFTIQLREPNLKWLGIGKNHQDMDVTINGIPIHVSDYDRWGGNSRSWIPTWIHIPDYNLTSLAATTSSATRGGYNISLCASRRAFRPVYWWFLIGVMILPPPTSSQPSSPPILSSAQVPN